jgi:hypothetical protein
MKKNTTLAGKSPETLEKLAFHRGIPPEDVKREMPKMRLAPLVRIDRAAENPAFLEKLEKSGEQVREAAKEHAGQVYLRERKDAEQSL